MSRTATFFFALYCGCCLLPKSASALFMEWHETKRVGGGTVTVLGKELGLTREEDYRKWFFNQFDGEELKATSTRLYYGWGRVDLPGKLEEVISVIVAVVLLMIAVPMWCFARKRPLRSKLPEA